MCATETPTDQYAAISRKLLVPFPGSMFTCFVKYKARTVVYPSVWEYGWSSGHSTAAV